MADQDVIITIRANDQASATIKRISEQLAQMGRTTGGGTRTTTVLSAQDKQAKQTEASIRRMGVAHSNALKMNAAYDAQVQRNIRSMGLAHSQALKMNAALTKQGSAITQTASAWSGLSKVVGAYIGLNTVQAIIKQTDAWMGMRNLLSTVTDSTEQLGTVQEKLYRASQNSRSEMEGSVVLYQRLARSVKSLGYTENQLVRVTEAVNKAFVVSGATAQEQYNAMIQFSQGLASNTLRADELRAVMEQAPYLARKMAEGMGIPFEKFRDASLKGLLDAKTLMNALLKVLTSIDEDFAKTQSTMEQGIIRLSNAWGKFLDTVNKSGGIFNAAAGGLASLGDALDELSEKAKENKGNLETIVEGFSTFGKDIFAIIGLLRKSKIEKLLNPLTFQGVSLDNLSNVAALYMNIHDSIKGIGQYIGGVWQYIWGNKQKSFTVSRSWIEPPEMAADDESGTTPLDELDMQKVREYYKIIEDYNELLEKVKRGGTTNEFGTWKGLTPFVKNIEDLTAEQLKAFQEKLDALKEFTGTFAKIDALATRTERNISNAILGARMGVGVPAAIASSQGARSLWGTHDVGGQPKADIRVGQQNLLDTNFWHRFRVARAEALSTEKVDDFKWSWDKLGYSVRHMWFDPGGVFPTMKKAMDDYAKSLGSFSEIIANATTAGLQTMRGGLQDAFGSLLFGDTDVDEAQSIIRDMIKTIEDWDLWYLTQGGEHYGSAREWVDRMFGTIPDNLPNDVEDDIDRIRAEIEGLLANPTADNKDRALRLIRSITAGLDGDDSMLGRLRQFGEDIASAISDGFETTITQMLADALMHAFIDLTKNVLIGVMSGFLKGLGITIGKKVGEGTAASALMLAPELDKSKMAVVMEAIKGIPGLIGKGLSIPIKAVWNGIDDAVGWSWKLIENWAGTSWKVLKGAWRGIDDAAGWSWKIIENWAGTAWKVLKGAWRGIDGIDGTAKKTWDAISSFISSPVDIVKNFRVGVEKLGEWGSWVDDVLNISKLTGPIEKTIKIVLEVAQGSISTIADLFSITGDIGKGIQGGVSSVLVNAFLGAQLGTLFGPGGEIGSAIGSALGTLIGGSAGGLIGTLIGGVAGIFLGGDSDKPSQRTYSRFQGLLASEGGLVDLLNTSAGKGGLYNYVVRELGLSDVYEALSDWQPELESMLLGAGYSGYSARDIVNWITHPETAPIGFLAGGTTLPSPSAWVVPSPENNWQSTFNNPNADYLSGLNLDDSNSPIVDSVQNAMDELNNKINDALGGSSPSGKIVTGAVIMPSGTDPTASNGVMYGYTPGSPVIPSSGETAAGSVNIYNTYNIQAMGDESLIKLFRDKVLPEQERALRKYLSEKSKYGQIEISNRVIRSTIR